jgi:SAM-dependent methyltransferase
MADWSLELAYESFPEVEEEFDEDLDNSLDPRGPDMLFDLVAQFALPAGASAIDVGCGEGKHVVQLADRFGLSVLGIDPVPRHVEIARAATAGLTGVAIEPGTAEQIPAADATASLIWCRDVLVHVKDLARAFEEFRRVLRPGGRALIYQMFGTSGLEPRESAWLWATMGVTPESADPAHAEEAMRTAGLHIDQRVIVGTEWGEWSQEHDGTGGRKLLHAARLLRARDTYVERYGQGAYDIMLGDCLWGVYGMIGKLERRVYVLSRPASSPIA